MQKDKLFPAQEKHEKISLVIRRHWFTYAIFWIVAVLLLAPLIGFIVYWLSNSELISPMLGNLIVLAMSVYSMFILALLIYGFVDFYLDVYIVTDKRIVDISQNGFFRREISELNLRQVQDVNAEVNGFFATLLHYGCVYIQTAGERENFVFEQIPHPYEVSKRIIDLHETFLKTIEGKIEEAAEDGYIDREEMRNSMISYSLNKNEEKKILVGVDRAIKQQKKEGTLIEGESIDLDETK